MTDTSVSRVHLLQPWRGDKGDVLSAASGVAWGLLYFCLIAIAIAQFFFQDRAAIGRILAAVLANNPTGTAQALLLCAAIGVSIGRLARPGASRGLLAQAWISLRDLYLAVTLLAVAAAFVTPAPHHWTTSLATGVLIMLWGVTFLGFVVILWPLSYLTHRLVWWAGERGAGTPPGASEAKSLRPT